MNEEYVIEGKIEEKEQKSGKKKDGRDWVRTVFVIENVRYATFDTDYAKEFDTGDEVKLLVKDEEIEKGEFAGQTTHNIKEMIAKDKKFVEEEAKELYHVKEVETPKGETIQERIEHGMHHNNAFQAAALRFGSNIKDFEEEYKKAYELSKKLHGRK